LNANGVEYLVVGGFAVFHYGYPRATGDLDIWIGPTIENGARCIAALSNFGFSDSGLTADQFTNPRMIFRIGLPPWRLEFLTSISGVEFAPAYARREAAVFDGVPVSVIGSSDLRANKRAAGRHKDLNDLEHLPE
jgi:hypothetical protein